MRVILLSLILVTSLLSFGQTLIIAKVVKDTIYVGADSRAAVTRLDSTTGRKETIRSNTACKISNSASIFFATAGFPGFTVHSYLGAQASSFTRIIDFAEYLDRNLKSDAGKIYSITYRDDTSAAEFKVPNRMLSQFIIFGFSGDSAILISWKIFLKNIKNNNVEVSVERQKLADELALGHSIAYDSILVRDRRFLWSRGVRIGIQATIKAMADARPDDIGGDIDIVALTKNGPIWLQRKSNCFLQRL